MLRRGQKAAFYALASPLMRVNGWLYYGLRAPRSGSPRVHLGPGQKNYLEGWINVDANKFTGRCDLWADLRNSLPFRTSTIECFYSHHVIEHLPNLQAHFTDVYRCLKPGGVYRFGGPHGDNAIRAFVADEQAWFSDFPDARMSIGGRFENFVFCRQEHLTILTASYLREVAERCGFKVVGPLMPCRETAHSALFEPCLAIEYESDFINPHTLLMEATKPRIGVST